ncbi:hypothetical protein FRC09_012007 [Ceratobasidium sp. 395]|nr:hypothetical protein FRC09_012007 [Ceratobasidium sp. 395]
MPRKQHKRIRSSTSSNHEITKDGVTRTEKYETWGLMNVPIDIFKEITSYLNPGDIIALARVNKVLRKLLMQRSAIHIWKRAERNVDMLPPCPSRFCEPQYAVLMFTKECSECGVSVMRPMDIDLGVRLCNACRSTTLLHYSDIPSRIRPYVPISAFIKKKSLYALRADVEHAESELAAYYEHPTRQVYKRWKNRRKLEYKTWRKSALALVRYVDYADLCREAEAKRRTQQRRDEIISRLNQHGWGPKYTTMLSQRRQDAWSTLVDTDKPLTDQAWKRLYPKLRRLLKRNRESWVDLGKSVRQCIRYDQLDELLTKTRPNICPHVEVAESSFPTFTAGEQISLPFPSLLELRNYHVFQDLFKTDRSVPAMVAKFDSCGQLVNNAILKWRAAFERELLKKVEDGRRTEKRRIFGVETPLIEDTTNISTKLTDSSYRYISAKNSVLFRADTIFQFENSSWVSHYPTSFGHLADYMRKRFEDQVEWHIFVEGVVIPCPKLGA